MRIDKSFSVLCSYGILSNPEVSSTDLRVYLYIKFRWQFFQSKGAEFVESVNTIAEATSVSPRSVQRSLKTLEALGYLEVVERPGKTSLYIPLDELIKK
ncbi:replication initiation protein [Escherichia phage 4MG]|uniref:Helix-turn-helix DNA-binding domain-containing protein n=1 Tax=Escherichia phage 4MG TaxID=1391428 RepID=V5KT31_9CAUD|nr:replication initiation protein [Escherichia phage 4MG]AGZ17712.1 helix-turn-helix DNA-binding domain-containing protein [Escherichia phage 4MG]